VGRTRRSALHSVAARLLDIDQIAVADQNAPVVWPRPPVPPVCAIALTAIQAAQIA